MNLDVIDTSILAWGMTFCGSGGLGLVIVAFMLENTYATTPWSCLLLVVIAAPSMICNSLKGRCYER